jgi:hypothetical protein
MLKALLKCNLQFFAEFKMQQFLQFEEIAISSSTLGAD